MLGLSLTSVTASDAAGKPAGANFIATGHDMDEHCSAGQSNECNYLKIVTNKVRNGSTLPILALDHGTQVKDALAKIPGEPAVTTVDPDNAAALAATKFTNASGKPLFSAIIVASDSSCGGCDNDATGEANINARKADIKTFFNHGGGILALSGGINRSTYYDFVPLSGVGGAAVTRPFTVTPAGTALGITTDMANCCATHNSFTVPSSPLVTLETDSKGLAATIAALNVSIGGGGFTSPPPSKSPKPTLTTSPTATSPTTPPIPRGAPNTGGGGTAGLQNAVVIGLGIGLLLAGAGLSSVAYRRQH